MCSGPEVARSAEDRKKISEGVRAYWRSPAGRKARLQRRWDAAFMRAERSAKLVDPSRTPEEVEAIAIATADMNVPGVRVERAAATGRPN